MTTTTTASTTTTTASATTTTTTTTIAWSKKASTTSRYWTPLATRLLLWGVLLVSPPHSSCQTPASSCFNLTVGLLLPQTGRDRVSSLVSRAARMTADEALAGCGRRGFRLEMVERDSGCSSGQGLRAALLALGQDGAQALLGPQCDEVCESVGRLAARRNVPVISHGCGSPGLSERARYPTFARTSGTYRDMGSFVLEVLHHFQLHQGVCFVSTNFSSHLWFQLNLTLNSGKTFWQAPIHNDSLCLREFHDKTTVSYVFVLLMFPEDTFRFLTLLKQNESYTEGFIFISVNYLNMNSRLNVSDIDFTGLLDISVDVSPMESRFKQFLENISNSGTSVNDTCTHYEYGVHAALMSDAVRLLIKGVHKSFAGSAGSSISMASFTKHLYGISFHGDSGEVKVDGNGTHHAGFMLHNLVDGCYTPVGRSRYVNWSLEYTSLNSTVVYPGRTTQKPSCPPHICGEGETKAGLIVTIIVVFILLNLICLAVKRRKTLTKMGQDDWLIGSEALFADNSGYFTSLLGGHGPRHLTDTSRESLTAKTYALGQIYTKVTWLDQRLVAIKQLDKHYDLEITSNVISEINHVRSLNHAHVNQLVGVCLEPGNVCLVWNYCSKGSLRDVLNNSAFRLDWMFKLSFITDIARGMAYLHSSKVGLHGRLRSTNVVVDDNWSCKVTDFDLPHFRRREGRHDQDVWHFYYRKLWTAPELLRQGPMVEQGTRKGDVYAFAIIMHEVLTRLHPFGLRDHDRPVVVIQRVLNGGRPSFRPCVPPLSTRDAVGQRAEQAVLDLMEMCWEEVPMFRPPFPTVALNLKKLREGYGMTGNLVDQMLEVVTKYTDNLEELVAERTHQLQEEQKRTEELLCRMLPKSVAHELKRGKRVEPESYQCITIFFSDIVGFTALASVSTPLQVVTMLNDLYTLFDAIVDNYDAYKIETIGDAYMVVSGLPQRNGDLHAGEIAGVALDILTQVLAFRIRHSPNKHLFLRIGLHSGPVVAGVVGLKMPRYCLFGQTVNRASAMESHGRPLHIHISQECKDYLDKLGGFHVVPRGAVDIKGVGPTNTYFLVAKDGLAVVTSSLPQQVQSAVGIKVDLTRPHAPPPPMSSPLPIVS